MDDRGVKRLNRRESSSSPLSKVIAGVLACVLWSVPAWPTDVAAQAASGKSDVTVQQQNVQMLDELKGIRQLLEKLVAQPPAPTRPAAAEAPDAKVQVAALPTDMVMGRADAPLTLIEFTDLQCPFCRQFHMTAFEKIKREYIDTGKLRYISRDFPLPQIHPLADTAAKASRCAADQNRFWEMRHFTLLNNKGLSASTFATFAQDLKLDVAAFNACTADANRHTDTVAADLESGKAAGVKGTPSFVLGRSKAGGVDGVRVVGALAFEEFDKRLKLALADK